MWRWDPAAKQLVRGWPGAETVTKDKAEEYYGTRFAKEALALDPSYAPAQNVLLSLALEKGAARAGLPPGKETPAVRDLLSTVNPDLITSVLERALDDQRPAVILPAVRRWAIWTTCGPAGRATTAAGAGPRPGLSRPARADGGRRRPDAHSRRAGPADGRANRGGVAAGGSPPIRPPRPSRR